MLSAGFSARSQNTFWHQGSDWRCCCTCQCHFPQAMFVLRVRCHIQRVHTAVTLFLLICSAAGSSEERCVWAGRRAGLLLIYQRADPSLDCTLASATCWKAERERSCLKILLILFPCTAAWPCSFALPQSACLPRDDSQEGYFPSSYSFPRGASAALSGLGQEDRPTTMCRS